MRRQPRRLQVRVRIALLSLVVGLITAATATAGAATPPKLFGVVGIHDAYSITLKNAKGGKIKTLKAGSYTFVVKDGSSMHNFYVEKQKGGSYHKAITTIPGRGTKTFVIKLTAGKYKYYCQAHESSMFGFITVT
jgi:hypothetical protein